MLDEMSPALMREWEEFDAIRGIGLERLIHAVARVGSAASGAFSGKCLEPGKFIPGFEDHEQTPEEMIAVCGVIAATQNGTMQ